MNWLSDDHVGKSVSRVCCITDHRCFSKSKILRPPVGPVCRPAMKRPLGDHRGDHMPSDPGSVVTWWLTRSRTRKTELKAPIAFSVEKTILCPSEDQLGSLCPPFSSGTTGCGVPPWEEMT